MEKESVNESNISQLKSAMDRMLKESRERLQTYSTERKQLVDEKVRNNYQCILCVLDIYIFVQIQYKDKAETLKEELSLSRTANSRLKEECEGLRAQLNKLKVALINSFILIYTTFSHALCDYDNP